MVSLPERVADYCVEHGLPVSAPSTILVGFSGGPDSTALLLVLHHLGVALEAVHLHHGLRADADADHDWCQEFCRNREIPFSSHFLDVPTHRQRRESVEMAARRLRLNYWSGRVSVDPTRVVALGHHQDDAITTFLLRLFRGSNSTGLTGLQPIARVGSLCLIRPLLGIPRSDILAWLKACDVHDFRIDASNDDCTIERNRVRTVVMPAIDAVSGRGGIVRTLQMLNDDARALDERADSVLADRESLRVDELSRMPAALWPRVLRQWLQQQTGDNVPLRGTVLRNVLRAITRGVGSGARLALTPDYCLRIVDGVVTVEEQYRPVTFSPVTWAWQRTPVLAIPEIGGELRATLRQHACWDGSDNSREWWSPASLPSVLTVRQREHGDRMVPFGSRGQRDEGVRLKKLIHSARLDYSIRHRLCVLCDTAGRILWVPLVRRSDHARVQSEHTESVELSFRFVSSPTNNKANL